jgi:hypothetical protein
MERLHEQHTNVLLEKHIANNADELIEIEVVVNVAKMVLAKGVAPTTAIVVAIDLFSDGLLPMLRMVDGLLGRVLIFWLFFFYYDFDL